MSQQNFINIQLFAFIHTLLCLKYTRSSVNICHFILTPVPYSISYIVHVPKPSALEQQPRRGTTCLLLTVLYWGLCTSGGRNKSLCNQDVVGNLRTLVPWLEFDCNFELRFLDVTAFKISWWVLHQIELLEFCNFHTLIHALYNPICSRKKSSKFRYVFFFSLYFACFSFSVCPVGLAIT